LGDEPKSILLSVNGSIFVLKLTTPVDKLICESPLHEIIVLVKTAVHAETIVEPDKFSGSIINVSFMSE